MATLSSCEAEHIAVLLYAYQATWMMNLVKEITGKNHGAMTMKIASMSSINRTKNPTTHGRRKHIEMGFYYLRDQVANGKLSLEHYR